MIKINLYNFNKRENSTRRPTGTGTEYDIAIKEPCGMLSPTIMLNLGLANAPTFNYARIEAFNRYYYVGEWIFERGCWTAQLKVDVLASANTYIGDHDLYVLRSSAESDGRVMDTIYPTLSRANSYIDEISAVRMQLVDGTFDTSSNYFITPINMQVHLGWYYIGVVGNNAHGTDYYCMTYGEFCDLVSALFNYTPDDFEDVSEGIAKSLANPIQYLVTCYWLPVCPAINKDSIVPPVQNVNFGHYSFSFNGYVVDPVAHIDRAYGYFNIRKHPQANSRGLYLNQSPYSNYTLEFKPFGTFNLDSTLMVDDTRILTEWYVDYITGEADFYVRSSNSLLASNKAQLAVPIPLRQLTTDYMGMINSGAQGVGSFLGSLFTGNIAGAISGVTSGITGAVEAKQPKVTSMGSGGSFLPYHSVKPRLYSDFYQIAEEYNDEIGRPLCKVRKPKNIKGYIKALDGSIQAPFTQEELQKINEYLTGGFYFYD